MNNFEKFILYVALIFVLIFVLTALTGCATPPAQNPNPGSQLLTKIIIQNNWLLTISIFGVGAGFFAFLNGNSKGISIMATCLVVMCLILCIAKFAVWLAVITMIGAVSLVAYTVLIRNRAFKEVVKGVQKYKDNVRYHSTNAFKRVLQEQSSQTKELVKKIKDKL